MRHRLPLAALALVSLGHGAELDPNARRERLSSYPDRPTQSENATKALRLARKKKRKAEKRARR